MLALDLIGFGVKQPRRHAVDDGDAPIIVEADHACTHAREHSLSEAAAFLVLLVGFHQCIALRAQLRSHAVEGAAKRAHLVIVAVHFDDARLEIAFRHALCRADQVGDRPHQSRRPPTTLPRSRPTE